ncbi:MAG: PIN domain-containing protein [Calditrichia bacterium]
MIALLDTDVLIDVALDRQPFSNDSAAVLMPRNAVSFKRLLPGIPLPISIILFLRHLEKTTKAFISDLLEFVDIAPTQTAQAKRALQLDLPDFEDALQVVAATSAGADFIVTRNLKHYQKSPVPAISPADFFQKLTAK